jgi:Coenzyme PQQ synthesis protein D (PqqD)
MDRLMETYAPRARQEDLVIEGLGEETLVYDMRNHKAHCLNRTAALVWERCDGRATVAEMTTVLEKELSVMVRAEVVWVAIEQLDKAQLLTGAMPRAMAQRGLSRRAVIQKIGLGAALALPLVTSILAPTSAEASTCIASPNPCTPGGTPCCSGSTCNCTGVCVCG